jgi:hypothetical protein
LFELAGMALVVAVSPASKLPAQYRQWLEEGAVYIISPVEHKVFLQLERPQAKSFHRCLLEAP